MAAPGNEVSSEEFARAWANPDNRRIINAALRRYARWLDRDEKVSLGMAALWYALRQQPHLHSMKLTTNLHKIVKYRCLDAYRALKRRKRYLPLRDVAVHPTAEFDDEGRIRRTLAEMPREDREVIQEHFWGRGRVNKEKLRLALECFRSFYGEIDE